MRQTKIAICCLVVCLTLVACGNHISNSVSSKYSNFTAKGEEDEYKLSGKSRVVNALHLVYISAWEDTTVDLSGELKSISGDVQIVYINPDNKETIITDSSKASKKGKLKLNSSVNIQKGESRLEFRGKESTFQFDLLFNNIEEDKIEYFTADKEYDEIDEVDSEDEDIEGINENNTNLLKEISVSYTNNDDNKTILETSLQQDKKIKVLVDASVHNTNDKENLSFGGFNLTYKTDGDNAINVLEYKTNEFAMGGYEWQNSFVREFDLPMGEHKLILNTYKGTNYEIKLNIKVYEVD